MNTFLWPLKLSGAQEVWMLTGIITRHFPQQLSSAVEEESDKSVFVRNALLKPVNVKQPKPLLSFHPSDCF